MNTSESIAAARDQLNRVLAFFPRVDTKASVVLGVNTGLLAVLATRALPFDSLRWEWLPIAMTCSLVGLSLWHLYKEAFPNLEGGEGSVIYFREVAARTEANYTKAWKEISDEDYLDDLLGQIWRNSEILRVKFNHMRWAFYSLALAIVPWIVSVVALTLRSTAH